MKDTSLLFNEDSYCVSSDSSFYISFIEGLKRKDWLFFFINRYHFYLGERLLGELSTSPASDPEFLASVNRVDVDYYELVRPYFGRHPKHLDDGEYEAIGIAHYLHLRRKLHYLIIDEKRIRNFVNKHFPYLNGKLVGGIGFIRDSCKKDQIISISCAIDMLTTIKKAIDSGKRIFGVDKNTYELIVAPILETLIASCKDE